MRKKGFTLVELLVVLIVIGLLAAFAIPQYLTAVEKTRVGKAKNNIALIAQAEKMFLAEQQVFCAVTAAVGNANIDAVCTNVAGARLTDFVEMAALKQDLDWEYGVTQAAGPSFLITATKVKGDVAYTAVGVNTITMTEDGVCSGGHPLRGVDCP